MLAEKFKDFVDATIHALGLPGAGLLMALESMVFPIPSEAVMPPLGFAIARGEQSWVPVIVVTSLGSLIGSLISYWIGAAGGKPIVHKFGKYALLNELHLEKTTAWFNQYGGFTVFVSRFVPVVRHLISLPAGVARMPLLPFCLYTVIGATLWNSLLLYLGYRLQQHWEEVKKYSGPIDYGFIGVCVIIGVAWFLLHRKNPEAVPAKTSPQQTSTV